MSQRVLGTLLVLIVPMSFAALPAVGQPQAAAGGSWSPPRTPWGHPDLQGTWSNTTRTPLERPAELETEFLTEEQWAERNQRRSTPDRGSATMPTGAYNNFWLEQGALSRRTSLIVDPDDGRLPPVTPAEEARASVRTDSYVEAIDRNTRIDSWEDLNVYDRCITRGMPGLMMPGYYNHNYQILQTPDYVAIVVEMIHDARIIPLDGRSHLAAPLRQWLGDSRGRWEGDTLVIETTTFTDALHGSVVRNNGTVFGGHDHHVVERLTRIDADTIDYRVTVANPAVWTRPWTAAMPMRAIEETLFEYACHDGNRSVPNILSGNRAEEQAASAGAR